MVRRNFDITLPITDRGNNRSRFDMRIRPCSLNNEADPVRLDLDLRLQMCRFAGCVDRDAICVDINAWREKKESQEAQAKYNARLFFSRFEDRQDDEA